MSIDNQVTHSVNTTGSSSSNPVEPKKGNLTGRIATVISNKDLDIIENTINSGIEHSGAHPAIVLGAGIVVRAAKVIIKDHLEEERNKINEARKNTQQELQDAFKKIGNRQQANRTKYTIFKQPATIQEWEERNGKFNKIKKEAERMMRSLNNNR